MSQGQSHFYILKNNAVHAEPTGGTHWLESMPGHVYCFIPSFNVNKGTAVVYNYMPEFLKDFKYCMEIKQVHKYILYKFIRSFYTSILVCHFYIFCGFTFKVPQGEEYYWPSAGNTSI